MLLKPSDIFTREEIQLLLVRSDSKAIWEVLKVWGWIGFAFFIVGVWPNPLTIVISLFILGGKQLGCAIIMHDASHYSLFRSKKMNDWIGNWLGAFPILHNVQKYRPYHIQHHIHTGSEKDPDLSLTQGYPTDKKGIFRKFFRDLTGLTGIKSLIGLLGMHFGFFKYELGGKVHKTDRTGVKWYHPLLLGAQNLWRPALANIFLFLILLAFGKPELYLMWPLAFLTTLNFSLRVRSIAEHSVVPDPSDPYKNTRTTHANFVERILFAPLYVNYHSEHHLLMTAPCYNFPMMHQLLKEKGFYKKGLEVDGYWNILKKAAGRME